MRCMDGHITQLKPYALSYWISFRIEVNSSLHEGGRTSQIKQITSLFISLQDLL